MADTPKKRPKSSTTKSATTSKAKSATSKFATKSKVKSTTATKAKAKPATTASLRRGAAAGGPLTLEEARKLVKPRGAGPLRAARRTAEPVATPATVAAERERLLQQRDAEREQDLREYEAIMELLTERGVVFAPASKSRDGALRAPPRAPRAERPIQPLRILSEGDSWFHYPILRGGGVIPRLEKRLGLPIRKLAHAGDEVRHMLGIKQRKRLVKEISEGVKGKPWDVLLFSGGGNDIVDEPMALWVRDWDPEIPPEQHLDKTRFTSALGIVKAAYEELILIRNSLSPNTQLVFHAYDYAIPDGRGVCFHGPWLKPAFDMRKFPNRDAASAVVRAMLQEFAGMLSSLAAQHERVTVINGQGTLTPEPSSWHNELHPDGPGYDAFARLFHARIHELFPERVAASV